MDEYQPIIADFTALFVASCCYALVLHRLRAWYRRENKTWVMVIIGVVLVIGAISALIPFGLVDLASFGIFVLAFCVAGLPIGVGEMLQDAHDAGLEEGRKERQKGP